MGSTISMPTIYPSRLTRLSLSQPSVSANRTSRSSEKTEGEGLNTGGGQTKILPRWKRAPFPRNEEQRLEAVKSYQVLDELGGDLTDMLTWLVASICGVKYSAISIIDSHRQYFFSQHGLGCSQTERDAAFCAHAILNPNREFIVTDATQDDRFADNPLITGGPRIRSYYGIPLVTPDGLALGTLCAIDTEPRELSAAQRKAVALLARQVMVQLELRKFASRVRNGVLTAKERKALGENITRLLQLFPTANPLILNASAGNGTSAMREFVTTLTDGEGLVLLVGQLMDEFSFENIFFWQAVEDYRASPNIETALSLYRVYVAEAGGLVINVCDETRTGIAETLSGIERQVIEGEMDAANTSVLKHVFDFAQLEVFSLVFYDSFYRLQGSPAYKNFQKVRSQAAICSESGQNRFASTRSRLARLLGTQQLKPEDFVMGDKFNGRGLRGTRSWVVLPSVLQRQSC